MRIEFLKDHGGYPVGREVDHPHPGVAQTLIQRGIARAAGGPVRPATATTTVVTSTPNAANPKAPRRK